MSGEILDCVPFVNGTTDLNAVREYYPLATTVRVSVTNSKALTSLASTELPLWIDAGLDGFHSVPPAEMKKYKKNLSENENARRADWRDFYLPHECSYFGDPGFQRKPNVAKVKKTVKDLLDACAEYSPVWLTVPQLPFVDDGSRNKLNVAMAKAAAEWHQKSKLKPRLILPAIFSHNRQCKGKTQWGPKLKQVLKCQQESRAWAIWVVNSQLADGAGSPSSAPRMAELVKIHQHLRETAPKVRVIAGPYWGMSLVLWARGLADYPAIGCSGLSTYSIPGGFPNQGKSRLMLPPLVRLATMNADLKRWLSDAIKGSSLPRLEALHRGWETYRKPEVRSSHRSKHYSALIAKLQAVAPSARALTLYQTLNEAYVVGSQLPELPKDMKAGRDAAQVAKQLMLLCLSS